VVWYRTKRFAGGDQLVVQLFDFSPAVFQIISVTGIGQLLAAGNDLTVTGVS